MLILSSLIYLALSFLLTLRVYRRISFSRVVAFFFLVTVSLNILVSEFLSFASVLDQPWLFLILQLIICLLLGFLLWDPRRWIFKQGLPKIQFEFTRPRGLDWIFLTLIVGVLSLSLHIGWLVPINNSDSLHTHLPRIYYWIQHGSLASWNAVTVTQVNKPINLSLQGLWLFLLGGSEKLFFLATWFALLTAIVVIYNIARHLGSNNRGALLAAVMGLAYPVILLQTYSYQADVFVSTLALASVALLLEYMRGKQSISLVLSLMAMAVALGAKNTALFILPFYLLVIFIYFIRERVKFKQYLVYAGAFLLLFGVFSSYKSIQNFLERDQLESTSLATHRYVNPTVTVNPQKRLPTNTLRYLYQSISLDGLTGQVKLAAEQTRANTFRSLSEWLGQDLEVQDFISEGDAEIFDYEGLSTMNEDTAWYGPLSFILIPITCLVVLFGKNKTRKRYLLAAFAFLIAVFLMMSIVITGWSPTNGRYLIMPILVFTPLFFVLLPARRVAGAVVAILIALCAGYLAFSSLLINDTNPLVTQFSLYTYQNEKLNRSADAGFISHGWTYLNDRVIEDLVLTSPNRRDITNQTYYQNLYHQSPEEVQSIEFVNVYVPADEPLYLYIQKTILEYALFGINKTRDLYPVLDATQIPTGALLLADRNLLDSVPEGMSLIAQREQYMLMRKD